MTARVLIKAAMRSADVGHLAEEIQRLEAAGIDGLHFDVMDGRFVPELYLGPSIIRGLRKYTTLPYEVHLLVQEPSVCLAHYVDAGANRVFIHIESDGDPAAMLSRLNKRGCGAGLAMVPGTPASRLEPYLDGCDCVNAMTVVPGTPGVLSEAGVESLREIAALVQRTGRSTLVQVDGAVSPATRQRFLDAGASSFVAGHPIFSRPACGEAIAELREAVVMKE